MPYPRRLLNDDEEIILDLHPHWWFYAPATVSTVAVGIVGLSANSKLHGWMRTGAGFVFLAALIVSAAWLVVTVVKWRTTYFVVTSHRVISRRGALARNGVEIPLDRISNVNFSQTIFERVLGVGDLMLESAGKDSADSFTDISRPEMVQNIVHQAIADRSAGSFRAAPSRTDIADQLERLEALRDRGTLTDEEFEEQKRRLLG